MVNDDEDDENTCVYAKSGVIISSLNERLGRLGCRLTGWCYFCNNVTSCLEIVPTWDTREDRLTTWYGGERDDENIHQLLFWCFR